MAKFNNAELFWIKSHLEESQRKLNDIIVKMLQDRGEDLTKNWSLVREGDTIVGYEEKEDEPVEATPLTNTPA
jgi:hypothetical protein